MGALVRVGTRAANWDRACADGSHAPRPGPPPHPVTVFRPMSPTDGDIADRFADELTRFRADHPDIRYVDGFIVDVNGHARGKRVPIDQAVKLGTGIPLCAAVLFLDPRGLTHDAGGMGISDGDPDILIRAVPGTLVPVPWSPVPLAQVLMEYRLPQGGPYPLEPRHVMAGVIERLAGAGLTPVVAYEAEFFLFDPAPGTDGALQPPRNPLTGQRLAEKVRSTASTRSRRSKPCSTPSIGPAGCRGSARARPSANTGSASMR